MKKYLALIVAIAMVLSLAVTAFVFTTSANAEVTDWNAYAEDQWDAAVAAGKAATKVQLRSGRYGANLEITPGNSVDLSTTDLFPYSAGTAALSEDGVLTLSNLVRREGDTNFPVIIGYGALKVVINGKYDGCIRNDEGTPSALFVTGGAEGGIWTCPANNDDMDVNNFRTRTGLYIYGNIGFDLVGVFQLDTSAGEVVLSPANNSKIDTAGKELFMKKNAGFCNKLVVAGGATVTIDDGMATTFKADTVMDTGIIVDGANLVWEDEFAECGGDNYELLPNITLKNGANFAAASVYPGSEEALLAKITCEDTSCFYIGEELKKGEPAAEATDWAAYAEAKWAVAPKAQTAKIVTHYVGAELKVLNNGDTNVDLAGVGPFSAGTASFVDGVLTLSGLEYAEGATVCPEIRGFGGAIKLVVDGCTYKGHFRNDYGDGYAAMDNAGIWLTAANGGVFAPDCGEFGAYAGNTLRSGHSIYVYDILTDICSDGFVCEGADEEIIFAPVDGSSLEVVDDSTTQGLFVKNGIKKMVFAGDVTIDINNKTTFAGTLGEAEWIIDGAYVVMNGKVAECSGDNYANISNITLQNGAYLDVEAFYNDAAAEAFKAKVSCDATSSFYAAGEKVVGVGLAPWAKYSEAKFENAVASGAAASYIALRVAGSSAKIIINPGESIDFATTDKNTIGYPCTAGTISLDDAGVVTISDLVWNPEAQWYNRAEIIGWGAMKVVINGEYRGSIRNDESNGAGKYGPLFITGGAEGGVWNCPENVPGAAENNFRTRNGLYVYGNIGFDVIGVFQLDKDFGEVVLAPEKDSKLDVAGNVAGLFMVKNGKYATRLVVSGGATVTIDDGDLTTFPAAVAVTDIIVDGAELAWEDEFAECGGDNYDLLPAITLKNGAKFTAASVYPGSQVALVEKVICDATSTFEILDADEGEGDEGGEGEGEGDGDADLDFGDIDVSTLTGWAKYAEDKWAAVTNKAPAVSIVGHGTGAPAIATLTNENNVVDLAGKDPFKAGIATFKDGVLTLTGLEYMEETTVHAEIRGLSGAIKVVINGCTFDGHVRNDYKYNGVAYTGMEDAAVFVTSKNGGKLACDCLAFGESYYDNAIRSGHSIYVYNVQVDLDRDGFVSEGSAEEVIFAPGVDSTIDITSAYGMFGKPNVTKVVFAGEGAIDVAIGEGFPVFNGNMFVEWIIDGADVTFAGLVKGGTSTVEFTVKNGAVLDIEALDEALTVEVTCEDTAAYYLGGELVKEGPGAGGDDVGGGEGGEGDEGEDEDPTGFVPAVNTTWAEYAEAKWAKENTAASYVVLGYIWNGTVTPENNITLNAENPTIDFAETPFVCYKAGTMTFANGVLTVKDLEYNEGHASSCNDGMIIAMGGAVKVVLDGCDFVGTIRNDWGAAASLYVQGVNGATWNTGIIDAEGAIGSDKATDNLMRSEGSMYVYGDLTLNVNAGNDALVRLTGAAGTEAIIAPEGGANITIAATKPIVINKTADASVARFVFGGGNVIKLNLLGANYTVGPDATTLGEFIVDATKLEVTGKFGVAATDVKYVLKNGAVLALDEIYKNAKITVEHGAYYLAGALVEANAPAGGEGGDNGNTSAALIAPFIVMIALTSVAAVMIVRKKRA